MRTFDTPSGSPVVMSSLVSPALFTPLLKLPLLISGTIFTHLGYTVPTPRRPDSDEQQKYGPATLVTGGAFFYLAAPVVKVRNHVNRAILSEEHRSKRSKYSRLYHGPQLSPR